MAKQLLARVEETTNKFGGKEIKIGLGTRDLEYINANVNDKGWVNLTLKISKEGKPYIEHWKPDEVVEATTGGSDDLPF